MSDAREQAVERLAKLVAGDSSSELSAEYVWDGASDADRADWRAAAAAMLRELGLVAVDPELVERVPPATVPEVNQLTGEDGGAPYHSADAPDCGIDGMCLRCQARLRIGNEALAQLGGGR